MTRVLVPGGSLVILEITQPQRQPLKGFFGLWFDRVVPLLGKVAGQLGLTTADLVETYNAMTGGNLTRFSSRGVAEVRTSNAIMAAEDAAGVAASSALADDRPGTTGTVADEGGGAGTEGGGVAAE